MSGLLAHVRSGVLGPCNERLGMLKCRAEIAAILALCVSSDWPKAK